MSPGIVVTGLGTVGSFGCGSDSLRQALAASVPATSEVDRSAGYHLPESSRRAGLVQYSQLSTWVPPMEARRMSPPSKLAVAAARMALTCAGLEPKPPESGTAVVVATSFGPSSYSEGLLKQILFEGPEATSPSLFTESVANAPAAQIAITTRSRGPSFTLCQREAGPILAVERGAAEVLAGRSPRALAGAVEEMTPLLHALLDRFGALARGGEGEEETARPFDRRRSGFLAGEGATILVLEPEGAARERGARVLARLLAWGSAFDPTALPTDWGTGHATLARALKRSLDRAGIALQDVDLIVSGAAGSRAGDRLEARMLHTAWGEAPLPPVVAPKGVTGEYGGGVLGPAVLAAAGAPFGPTPGFAEPDPELDLVPHDGKPLAAPGTVLVTSLAVGGAAAWLVLGKP
ncbi:MAG TPA: beta-ketoacyl synthase N-terminal-like domain-containing protein [Thermoanaerobaculia bacterium]|nr:beta-ketoacyl synthase N-terminal-like domain-containing protein [Thermoanaerobaculia bacterium]